MLITQSRIDNYNINKLNKFKIISESDYCNNGSTQIQCKDCGAIKTVKKFKLNKNYACISCKQVLSYEENIDDLKEFQSLNEKTKKKLITFISCLKTKITESNPKYKDKNYFEIFGYDVVGLFKFLQKDKNWSNYNRNTESYELNHIIPKTVFRTIYGYYANPLFLETNKKKRKDIETIKSNTDIFTDSREQLVLKYFNKPDIIHHLDNLNILYPVDNGEHGRTIGSCLINLEKLFLKLEKIEIDLHINKMEDEVNISFSLLNKNDAVPKIDNELKQLSSCEL